MQNPQSKGFIHFRPGKREKSESLECTSAWYSMAIAAIWASVTGVDSMDGG